MYLAKYIPYYFPFSISGNHNIPHNYLKMGESRVGSRSLKMLNI